jgi:6-phosphogluconolactonase/glucosamine-6-phosphate isomerase/deaminase
MDWVHVTSEQAADSIAGRLATLLESQPVTWFVSGGSNIGLQTRAIRLLATHSNISQLTILLIDERYGPIGHQDSNWQQLTDAGFMIDGPQYIAPFTSAETTLDDAVQRYETIVADQLATTYCFAQLGMGNDGHVSGILPGSPAAATTSRLVMGYEHEPYQRLTTTFRALRQLHEIALVAYGQAKWPQLAKLIQSVSPIEQPAQIIKDIPLVTIYTDYQETNS